jgi:methyltransferase
MFFYFLISAVIVQRLIELKISKRNGEWLLSRGAIEYGKEHYKFIVLLHTAFFISMIAEYNLRGGYTEFNIISYLFLIFFLILQLMRVWVLKTLGKYWNTRIFRIPDSDLIKTGPYKYLRHPNYAIVACEIFILPMIFNLYYTAIIFSILNAVILSVRIKAEDKALIK